jgi:hypothetical protein
MRILQMLIVVDGGKPHGFVTYSDDAGGGQTLAIHPDDAAAALAVCPDEVLAQLVGDAGVAAAEDTLERRKAELAAWQGKDPDRTAALTRQLVRDEAALAVAVAAADAAGAVVDPA